MLIYNGETVLDVTPKAYEVIYKDHGYTVQTKEEPKEEPEAPPVEKQAEPIKQKVATKKAKAKVGEA